MDVLSAISDAFQYLESRGVYPEKIIFSKDAFINARKDCQFEEFYNNSKNGGMKLWGANCYVGNIPYISSFACVGMNQIVIGTI